MVDVLAPQRPPETAPRPAGVVAAAVSGVIAAGLALAVGELVTALADSPTSLVTAVGNEFVDRFAASLKDLAVRLFGTNDKVALVTGIVITSLVLGAVIGILARRRPMVGLIGFGAFGLIGAWALTSDPQGSAATAVLAAAASVIAGTASLWWLLGLARSRPPAEPDATNSHATKPGSRRSFLLAGAGLAAGAVAALVVSRWSRSGNSVNSQRAAAVLPPPDRLTPPPVEQPFRVDGLSPYVTPNGDFYRIDTALSTPQVNAETWRLRVSGMVDEPFELTYDELLAMDSVAATVTIACVSNEVGGRLVGNAEWQGVPLSALLERAGVQDGATQIVGRSVDGFTAGFPTADGLDGRTAIVAYAMNGEPLPADHGFPARLIIAGLYGYVSATKWLEEIELTTWEDFDGYWVPRGWSKEGPIKTQSRIDVPRSGATLTAGRQAIAGVAWAPGRGIERVEVQVDDGAWQEATLGRTASDDTWVQWHLPWDATSGDHRLRVRATDGAGETQTEEESRPAPDGATGWHARDVRVA